ncbi:hypothetical protein N7481_010410 [Penicillium waksmanii]|uniref:uncharacterized protein n=1 Tax=Penicillium waksmanii TaxID=69791 RepID=UPI0025478416|nr:uncharacterized protein N7481_010410 [Penicillium waksmanii]KAJ5973200.1 hypothetical protein N7481_010410 [Penicillium waksmanii]
MSHREQTLRLPPPTSENVTIALATYQSMQENESFLQSCLKAAVPSLRKRQELMRKVRQNEEFDAVVEHAEPNSPSFDSEDLIDGGHLLADPDGQSRFIGSASGAAFLDQIRHFVVSVSPLLAETDGGFQRPQIDDSFGKLLGIYQTHDSRTLPLPQVDPYFLPPYEDAVRLLSPLCSSTQAMNGVHIYFWGPVLELLQQAYLTETHQSGIPDLVTLATLNSALAFATQQTADATFESARAYFARAIFLLGRPLEATTKRHITCLLLLGCFLLGEHRRDGAYAYIRMAGHLAVTYGFHQSQMTGEAQKRLFWTIYALERY